MKVLAGAVLAAAALVAAACGSAGSPTAVHRARFSVSSTRLIENGTVRCTATVRTTPVAAGDELGRSRVVFAFRNVSDHKVQLGNEEGSAVVRSPDGTTYDPLWLVNHSIGGIYIPPSMPPGARKTTNVYLPRVAWEGPLTITPRCGSSTMPAVQVRVTSPGPPMSERAALAAVVAASRHLLDHCRPRASGESVFGVVEPPRGAGLQPFRARCSVTLRDEKSFYVAQVLVRTPPGLRNVRVLPPYEELHGPFGPKRNAQAIAWEFVVTRHGAIPVTSAVGQSATWQSAWLAPGENAREKRSCGGYGGSGGGSPPQFGFLSSYCVPQK